MSSNQSVNIGGAIRALANLGFHPKDLLAEGIDNSLGVKATHIRITIDSNQVCSFVDNGPGMNRAQLVKRFTLYEDSKASDACQGRFGIGEDAKHALLTEFKKPTKTITNSLVGAKSLSLTEIELDWPTAVERNEFALHAHDASRKSEDAWKLYAIDPTKPGTLDLIPLSESIFKYFTENSSAVIAHFEQMYAEDLNKGLVLEFQILGTKQNLVGKHLLQEVTDNTKTLTHFRELRVWQKRDGTLRVCFKDSKDKWVYKDGRSNISCDTLESEGFVFIGPLTIDYAYNPQWKKLNPQWKKLVEQGGIYYKRNNKIIQQRKVSALSGGDYDRQDLETAARAIVTFSVKFDALFGLEVNKSHIDKIHFQLESQIKDVVHELSNKTWNQLKKMNPPATTGPSHPVTTGPSHPATAGPSHPATAGPSHPATAGPVAAGGLDAHITITPKPKPAVAVPTTPPAPATPAAPALEFDYHQFQKRFLPELRQAHPDWEYQEAFGEVGRMWSTYKKTGKVPIFLQPTTPVQPIPTPAPATKISITKNQTDSTVVIADDTKIVCVIHYVGQFNIIDSYLKQVLQQVGDARFKEYALQLAILNNNFLK